MKTLTHPWKQAVTAVRPTSRRGSTRVARSWTIGWLGLAAIAIVNGGLRQGVYARWVTDQVAHQLSTVSLIVLSAGYVWWMQRRWPLPSTQMAVRAGGAWFVLTVVFEFGFGHYVVGESWSTLLTDYDLSQGRIWILVPLWVLVAPAAARHFAAKRA